MILRSIFGFIEAGIVLCQCWAERKRPLLVICPVSICKQWALELAEKFNLPAIVLDAKGYREALKPPKRLLHPEGFFSFFAASPPPQPHFLLKALSARRVRKYSPRIRHAPPRAPTQTTIAPAGPRCDRDSTAPPSAAHPNTSSRKRNSGTPSASSPPI